MTTHPTDLPHTSNKLFLADGGIETTLVFHEGFDLPYFAAFDLLRHENGRAALRRYYQTYVEIARRHDCGFVLESATWRASADWGDKLGYSRDELAAANCDAIALLDEIRRSSPVRPMVISGCVGPRGDGYDPGALMTADEAEAYHVEQIATFAGADVDLITAVTMTNIPEAIGVSRAAKSQGLPVAISFTVETDGTLPTGDSLQSAIEAVDEATDAAPGYFMINCAHPTHFEHVLAGGHDWLNRIRGIRANASCLSHAELGAAEELDAGDPADLGARYRALAALLPKLSVVGGCCGTDHRHIEAIAWSFATERPEMADAGW